MQAQLRARWFEGRSSRAQDVLVRVQPGARGPDLEIAPSAGVPLHLACAEVDWPEAWSTGRMPRKLVVDLRARGSLEVDDVAGWHAAVAAAGHQAPLAQQMQTRWRVFVLALAVAAAALAAFYRWGTPWAATQLTRQVPLGWEMAVSEKALRDLDAGWLHPSKLPPERQEQLRARFERLAAAVAPELRRYPGYAPTLQLQFRSGLGANAFALPGGTIVMTDGMVEAAAKHGATDDALVGVLAHEIGHVMHRHTTRLVVEQGVLNIGFGLALGDLSALASTGASILTGLAYRRSHETEADCFAVALMTRAALPTAPMADLLLKIDPSTGGKQEKGSWTSLLSSHPETAQRARELKAGQAPACR